MSRIEKMEGRRQSIVQAAETLIRETGSTDFSMHDLARTAGLSTATTYNLIGSKSTVLYRLLNGSLDELSTLEQKRERTSDPVGYVDQMGGVAVDFFAGDPGFFRPLMRFLLGVPDAVLRPVFMRKAYDFWVLAVSGLVEQGMLRPGVEASDLGRSLHVFFTGALDLWVHEELDRDQFRAQIRQASILLLLGAIVGPAKDGLIGMLAGTRANMKGLCEPRSSETAALAGDGPP